jgi:hypothetical protein
VHKPFTVRPAVSLLKVWSGVHVTGPLIESVPSVWTVTFDVYQSFKPRVPAVIERLTPVGGVLSSLTVRGVALVIKPALLVHEPLKVTPVVSVFWNWSAVQTTGLLIESVPLVWLVTSEVYQPLAPGVPAETDNIAVGPVLSIFTVMTLLGSLTLLALSVAVCAVDETEAPSALSTWSAGHEGAMPDKLSVQVNCTVTFEVYQLFEPSVPALIAAEIVGFVASRLIVTDWELAPPVLVAKQVSVVPAVSVLIVVGPQPVLVKDDSGSTTVQETETLLVYHPLVRSVPTTLGVMTGGELSHEITLAVTVKVASRVRTESSLAFVPVARNPTVPDQLGLGEATFMVTSAEAVSEVRSLFATTSQFAGIRMSESVIDTERPALGKSGTATAALVDFLKTWAVL